MVHKLLWLFKMTSFKLQITSKVDMDQIVTNNQKKGQETAASNTKPEENFVNTKGRIWKTIVLLCFTSFCGCLSSSLMKKILKKSRLTKLASENLFCSELFTHQHPIWSNDIHEKIKVACLTNDVTEYCISSVTLMQRPVNKSFIYYSCRFDRYL